MSSAVVQAYGLRKRRGGNDINVPSPSGSPQAQPLKAPHIPTSIPELTHSAYVGLDGESQTAVLWLKSRIVDGIQPSSALHSTPTYRPRGEDRPLTFKNVEIAFQLSVLLWRPFLKLFWGGRRWQIMGSLGRKLIKGSLPAAK
jgi:hypothetical protein